MSQQNRFVIRNNLSKPLELCVEPFGSIFPLAEGEEVTVRETFSESPVNLILTDAKDGGAVLSVWPGDGDVTVESDGVDVLGMEQQDTAAEPAPGGQSPN